MTHHCEPSCVSWTGTNKCHCSACGETFTSVSAFDRHRAGSQDKKFRQGECSNPADRGLVQNARGYWKMPGEREYE